MNIHPIFVHFPIALLTIYALLELIIFKKVNSQDYWFYIKASFAILGSLATATALYTGSMAEDLIPRGNATRHLVSIHSDWAVAATTIFGVLGFCYLVEWINKQWQGRLRNKSLAMVWNL